MNVLFYDLKVRQDKELEWLQSPLASLNVSIRDAHTLKSQLTENNVKLARNNLALGDTLDNCRASFLKCLYSTRSFRPMADWGISSNGRAPALHAGGTGIDAQILHTKSASYFTAHVPDWGVLRRTQIATVVSNRTAFATTDDNFTQLFGKFQLKIYFRLLPRSFPSHFIITGATIKSLIINELLLWETSLLFTIGPMHAYIRVQPLTTKPRSSKIISKPLRSFTYVTWEFFPFTLLWEFTGVNVHAIRR